MVLFINSRCKTKPSMPRTSNLTIMNAIPFYELQVQNLLRDDPANFTPTPFNGYSINELSQVLFSRSFFPCLPALKWEFLRNHFRMVKSAFESLMIGLYLSVSSSVNPDPSKADPTSKLVIPSFCLASIALFRIKRRTFLNSWSFRLNFLTGKAKAIEDKNTLFPQVWSFWSINKWTICYGDTRSFWSHS